MEKENLKKLVESRIRLHKFILEFHKEVINLIGQKEIRKEGDLKTLVYAVRSTGKVLELIEQDKRELKNLES